MERQELLEFLHSRYHFGDPERTALKQRRKKLRACAEMLYARRAAIYAAIAADLGRGAADTIMCELMPLNAVIRYLARKLPALSRGRLAGDSAATFPSLTRLMPEPYGRVLVVATWNYPLLLALEPALGAYAAGNQVVLKLSNRSLHTMQLIRTIIETIFTGDEITVIGNELEFDEVLAGRYDYVFATGSAGIGRKILRACAENLTPATLELGGKNPCIVHRNANLKVAAKRIVWSKFLNGGQSCAAPDHLWVHQDVKQELLLLTAKYIRKFYGEHPLDNSEYCKMPDTDAYDRVCRLLGKGRLVIGGERSPQQLAIEPTVVDQISPDDPEFAGEIFGPLLPVFDYVSEADVVARIQAAEKPLAIYCFGGSRKMRQALQHDCSSGALVFDDAAVHFANANVPFGGVGASGMGAYHGKKSFSTFVHYKPVMRRATWLDNSMRYPPFSRLFCRILELLARF
ncbi:MAG: aldehyde dehydrogenase family protein [Lentisphaeria bacterium]|nr:aldehyde dehydrogenase family protein [Lentisphaeria bacterium]